MSALEKERAAADAGQVPESNWLIYDGDCPFCSRYVQLLRIRESVGPLKIVNARDGGAEAEEVSREGLDLNEGMVLKLSGRLYHGHDCVHALALLGAPKGLFSRFNSWVFRSPRRAALIYPVLRTGRNFTLRLMGRKKIEA